MTVNFFFLIWCQLCTCQWNCSVFNPPVNCFRYQALQYSSQYSRPGEALWLWSQYTGRDRCSCCFSCNPTGKLQVLYFLHNGSKCKVLNLLGHICPCLIHVKCKVLIMTAEVTWLESSCSYVSTCMSLKSIEKESSLHFIIPDFYNICLLNINWK